MKFRSVCAGLALLFGALAVHACGGGAAPPADPTPIPTPGSTQSFPVILAAGDISCDSATPQLACQSKETSDILVRERARVSPAAVVVLPLGDLQYDKGSFEEFTKNYHATWGRLNDIAHPVVGNHEYDTRNANGYFDYFAGRSVAVGARNEGWYEFTVGEWHFVALNSNCDSIGGCNVGSAQYRWLQADLTRNQKKCTVAYMHHPFQSSGMNGGTSALLPLMQLLHQNNVELVLAGHDHDYERFEPITPDGLVPDPSRGLRLFVVGTGGRDLQSFTRANPRTEFRTNDHYGVLRIVMKDLAYDWAFLRTDGVVIDANSGVCF